MHAEGQGTAPALSRRRYTGVTRGDAEAGFKLDWPGISAAYDLVAEMWDEDTHTLTVMLRPRPAPPAAGDPPDRP
jgi:hypothetical protein